MEDSGVQVPVWAQVPRVVPFSEVNGVRVWKVVEATR